MFREGQAPPLQNFPTQNPPFAINSGFFIFNSQHSSKWCPAVKQYCFNSAHSTPPQPPFHTIPCYALYSCHMNALLALRPCKASGRSTSGIHARPLSKGGGLTAMHKLLLCCFLLAICPPFLYCKLFCCQDGGIVLHPHHQLDFPHYHPRFS